VGILVEPSADVAPDVQGDGRGFRGVEYRTSEIAATKIKRTDIPRRAKTLPPGESLDLERGQHITADLRHARTFAQELPCEVIANRGRVMVGSDVSLVPSHVHDLSSVPRRRVHFHEVIATCAGDADGPLYTQHPCRLGE
jgi:hypothetical protein